MKQRIECNGKDIYFKIFGKNLNRAIFLLHGYLESSEIWDEFAPEFSDDYFIVCVDLPGHGESESLSEIQTMEEMAHAVKGIADSLGIKKIHLAGHSMGGYVTMAFRELFPEMLNSFVLFHSTCFADSEEKRMNRDREIELVKKGRKDLIVNTHISKAFADSSLKKLVEEVEKAKQIALKTKENGIVSALNGMKLRKDRSYLLTEGEIPLLLIAGIKDNYIPIEVMTRMKNMAGNIKLLILEESGHMGFFEEKGKAVKELKAFFNSAINRV